ncbi:hypothetical protein QWJ34_03445 [Saccharibacillus sp. CPCC 101409]|uniref:hypothetical protein n=1 Tax=Saccharibacillus sp. CPCC 101409 TaxID=3058041 RepID=UPI002673A685|nr:hypothetical protein [Saccharibacillus sp. CPCC 101409]MDO3408812.1 hypothetical protein [Saccharibacillus sp. CPCC 101409]
MKASTGPTSSPSRSKKKDRLPVRWFLLFWVVLIGLFVYAAYLYSERLQEQTLLSLQSQTQAQMADLRADYEQQFTELNDQVAALQSKVDSFNELLTFTKDNANDKTDNSNKLYTQLDEVKTQLSQLQKKMDLLK